MMLFSGILFAWERISGNGRTKQLSHQRDCAKVRAAGQSSSKRRNAEVDVAGRFRRYWQVTTERFLLS